jgi:Zn-dependent protease
MFGKRIDLFKLFGFEVRIDLSWVVLAILVAWSLSAGLFPFRYEGLSTQAYWIMGIVGAIGLFLSIIAHEMSHSLVAKRFGMPIKGITLFIFGGVAEMKKEPPTPKAEFAMAVAGSVSSVFLALVFYVVFQSARATGRKRSMGSFTTSPGSTAYWRSSTSFPPFPWTAAGSFARSSGAGRKISGGRPVSPHKSAPCLSSFSSFRASSSS